MKDFKTYLIHQNLSKNTIESYQSSVNCFFKDFEEINKQNLLAFKATLVDSYKGKTVNLRIQGINNETFSKIIVPKLTDEEIKEYDKKYNNLVYRLSCIRQEIKLLSKVKENLLSKYF